MPQSVATSPTGESPVTIHEAVDVVLQLEEETAEQTRAQYLRYMFRTVPNLAQDSSFKPATPSPSILTKPMHTCEQQYSWLNALICRFSWDFLREPYWADMVKDKVQKKLSKIHVSVCYNLFRGNMC